MEPRKEKKGRFSITKLELRIAVVGARLPAAEIPDSHATGAEDAVGAPDPAVHAGPEGRDSESPPTGE